jgi:adenosine deaminase
MGYTELHRHLDASLRPSTLLELAQARGLVPQSTSFEAFIQDFQLKTPLTDLGSVLRSFTLFQKVLDGPEVLERIGREVIEDCAREGIDQVELRFSPGFVAEYSHLNWESVLNHFEIGVQNGLKKFPGMKAGFLLIGSRDLGLDSIQQTVDFFIKHSTRFLGIDLAGDETLFPNSNYAGVFKPLLAMKANVTIHAGEAVGPDSVWQAIELLGAKRIGHGVNSERDPKLLQYLIDHQICLEMCPTSNWITSCVKDLSKHPLPRYLRAGVPVCINTDDPGIFGVDLPHEILVCKNQMGMTDQEIAQCFANAKKHSFLS